MKVSVSVGGLWHSPPIVEALYQNGYLKEFYTSRPYFKLPNLIKSMERDKINTISYIDYLQALTIRVLKRDYQYQKAKMFDKIVSERLEPCDIFVVWSSFGVESIKKAKMFGAVTVLERGSTHILEQDFLLRQLYSRRNLEYTTKNGAVSKKIIQRELQEYELADKIFVPSQFVYDSFIKHGISSNKLVKIPYGADICRNFKIEKKNFFDEELRILFVGEISLRKGICTLMDTLRIIKNKVNVKLVMAGNMNEYARNIIDEHSEIIEYRGVLSKSELAKEYNKSHILILPSIEEGLARVILEGMSYGLCPICSYNTGAADVIEDKKDGFLVKIYDSEEMAAIIIKLYNDRNLLEKICRRSLEKVKNFSNDCYKDNIIKQYQIIMNEIIKG